MKTLGRLSLPFFTLATTIAAACSSGSGDPAPNQAPPPAYASSAPQRWDEWRTLMSKTTPPREGCFKASHPSNTWEEVPCGDSSPAPRAPSKETGAAKGSGTGGRLRPQTVGGGGSGDHSSEVAGTISWAQGSFPIVTGGASGSSYSLQLNTGTWTGPLCRGGNCYYWEQFSYDTVTSQIYIQEWLVNATSCPSSAWTQYTAKAPLLGGCYIIGPATRIPGQPIANLPNLAVTGAAGATFDTMTMWTGDGQLYATNQASLLGLAGHWSEAEFNVFGSENETVAFDPGTSIVVQTLTNSTVPTLAAPTCVPASFTHETNNLDYVPNSCCAFGGIAPGIWFTESNVAGASPEPCPDLVALVPGGGLAASNQFGLPENTDLFSIDRTGALTVSWASPGAWTQPVRITPTETFPPGAPIAASQQFGLTQTDVFAAGHGGNLDVSWVAGSGAWQGPSAIGAHCSNGAGGYFTQDNLPCQFVPSSHLATSQQFGLTQTDVFAVDANGALTVTWAAGGGSWQSAEITAQHQFPAGAPLAASQQFGLTQTDVFLVGNSGQLEVVWVGESGGWHGPALVGNGGQFEPGAHVVASNQFGLPDNTDVFAIDSSGNLNVAWVNGGNPFQGPVALTTGSQYPAGGPLAVSQQFDVDSTGQTDVFLANRNGFLFVMWVEGGNSWQGPALVGNGGPFLPAGGEIVASPQFGIQGQTDVFLVDGYGDRSVSWAQGANPWNGPSRIP